MEYVTFFHGGDLSNIGNDVKYTNKRCEYGAGLYITTHEETARRYAKGSRKLYSLTVEEGNDLEHSFIPVDAAKGFISSYVPKQKRADFLTRLEKHKTEQGYKAYIFDNIIHNDKLLSNTNLNKLVDFYVENNIDHHIVENPFGWGETMIVLYNIKKIKHFEKIIK
jgi:hypothetical protein